MNILMGIVLAAGIVILYVQAYKAGIVNGKRTVEDKPPRRRRTSERESEKLQAIQDIVRNIDTYDGTDIGQKEVNTDETDWVV